MGEVKIDNNDGDDREMRLPVGHSLIRYSYCEEFLPFFNPLWFGLVLA